MKEKATEKEHMDSTYREEDQLSDDIPNQEKVCQTKGAGKNYKLLKNAKSHVTTEEFSGFIEQFFVTIKDDLIERVTVPRTDRANETKNTDLESNKKDIKKSKRISKKKRIKLLRKRLEDIYDFDQPPDYEVNLSKNELKLLAIEVVNEIITDKNINLLDINENEEEKGKVFKLYKKQIEINRKRMKELRLVMNERLKRHAYLTFLEYLEKKFEASYISGIKNKRIKKNKEAGYQTIDHQLEQLKSFREIYGNIYNNDCCEYYDIFNSGEEVNVNEYGIDETPYFE